LSISVGDVEAFQLPSLMNEYFRKKYLGLFILFFFNFLIFYDFLMDEGMGGIKCRTKKNFFLRIFF